MKSIGARKPKTHTFDSVPEAKINRSSFDLSHGYKSAFNSQDLVPFYVDMVYPGDTFNVRANCFARLSTPIVPFMDNLYLDTFFFAVPIRLIWSHFQQMMGQQANPGDSISYTIPQVQWPASGFTVGSLYDYMGVPTVGQIGGGNQKYVNNLFPRAYNLIWNEWFRDENQDNSVTVDLGDGPDTYTNYTLLQRRKKKDYFTSALPWPQKGTAVSLPLGTTAPVGNLGVNTVNSNAATTYATTDFNTYGTFPLGQAPNIAHDPTTTTYADFYQTWWNSNKNVEGGAANTFTTGTGGQLIFGGGGANLTAMAVPFGGLTADLSAATAATINQLRQAIQIQALLERDARCGTRYTEIIQGHFGVISPDARLQRPEYLGGGSTPIKVNPIAQTSNTPASGTPQGNLAAYGVVATKPNGFTKSFTEHCVLIGLVNVRADISYQQGLEKLWSYQTRYDLYWPAFAHLGEQAILNQELYCDGSANDTAVFGYQERYGELRFKQSKITGLMRSTAATTLNVWHLAQKFTSLPTLNSAFMEDASYTPINRVQAVTTEPQFIFDAWLKIKAARPMPVFGIPAQLARF